MNWISTLTRMAGSATPLTAPLVTLQTEKDSAKMRGRLDALEDPISALHGDVHAVAQILYEAVRASDSKNIDLAPQHLKNFSRVLAVLEAHGLIGATHTLGGVFPAALWIASPTFFLYMAGLYEDSARMKRLLTLVEAAPPRTWLHGKDLAEDFNVPLPVVGAVFELLEANGLGLCSGETGTANYYTGA